MDDLHDLSGGPKLQRSTSLSSARRRATQQRPPFHKRANSAIPGLPSAAVAAVGSIDAAPLRYLGPPDPSRQSRPLDGRDLKAYQVTVSVGTPLLQRQKSQKGLQKVTKEPKKSMFERIFTRKGSATGPSLPSPSEIQDFGSKPRERARSKSPGRPKATKAPKAAPVNTAQCGTKKTTLDERNITPWRAVSTEQRPSVHRRIASQTQSRVDISKQKDAASVLTARWIIGIGAEGDLTAPRNDSRRDLRAIGGNRQMLPPRKSSLVGGAAEGLPRSLIPGNGADRPIDHRTRSASNEEAGRPKPPPKDAVYANNPWMIDNPFLPFGLQVRPDFIPDLVMPDPLDRFSVMFSDILQRPSRRSSIGSIRELRSPIALPSPRLAPALRSELSMRRQSVPKTLTVRTNICKKKSSLSRLSERQPLNQASQHGLSKLRDEAPASSAGIGKAITTSPPKPQAVHGRPVAIVSTVLQSSRPAVRTSTSTQSIQPPEQPISSPPAPSASPRRKLSKHKRKPTSLAPNASPERRSRGRQGTIDIDIPLPIQSLDPPKVIATGKRRSISPAGPLTSKPTSRKSSLGTENEHKESTSRKGSASSDAASSRSRPRSGHRRSTSPQPARAQQTCHRYPDHTRSSSNFRAPHRQDEAQTQSQAQGRRPPSHALEYRSVVPVPIEPGSRARQSSSVTIEGRVNPLAANPFRGDMILPASQAVATRVSISARPGKGGVAGNGATGMAITAEESIQRQLDMLQQQRQFLIPKVINAGTGQGRLSTEFAVQA